MKRIHHTDMQHIIRSKTYDQKVDYKPSGLWYGIDWAWEEWCIGNMPDWQHQNHFELDVDMEKILVLDSVEKVDKFQSEFGEFSSWAKKLKTEIHGFDLDVISINWSNVSEKYSGIEINPYQYSLRRKLWLSGWDISSGCIWNLSAVKSYESINKI